MCQFETEQTIGKAFELLNAEEYPNEYKGLIEEVNSRGRVANEKYKMARHREKMLASGFEAGMYITRFNEQEESI